ncbi:hypothetical protein BAUCODRAFT_39860 [Baudoinia panamericana UAMH 10762]|uniref:Cytochrome b561 domain-containing protein n=1 Tax=Baudoinia panamericana (strain UAMH 10762) TaxID=717646 RepID=M2MX67_BAUPA|nr:uncharacterized protein BAUCODRAFT_39860 [Baudoinia panamericana UAMH 10762]EMC90845.1 hypothetical protein BAUCODRAFT_39860 [Baudoinia panamericana UAMH 10762]
MCFAFVAVFPTGSLLLRLFQSVTWHWAVQCIGVLLVIVGLATGVSISREYNRGKGFTSAHQVLGLLLFAGVIIQLGLGIINHAIHRRTKQGTAFGKVHLFLGPTVMLLALINGGLGLNLAGDTQGHVPYAIAVLAAGILFILARAWIHLFMSHAQYKPEEAVEQYPWQNSFGLPSSGSPFQDVETPASYKSEVTNPFTFEMASPVTMAPMSPRWPAPPKRTFSSAWLG